MDLKFTILVAKALLKILKIIIPQDIGSPFLQLFALLLETFCDKSNDAIMECVEMWYEVKNALLEQQGNQQQSLLEIKESKFIIIINNREIADILLW